METAIFVLIVAMAFYFILLRPVLQQQRRQRKDLVNLNVGDEVLTQGGLIAHVKEVQIPEEGPTILVLDLGSGVEVRAVPTAIVQKLNSAEQPQQQEQIRGS